MEIRLPWQHRSCCAPSTESASTLEILFWSILLGLANRGASALREICVFTGSFVIPSKKLTARIWWAAAGRGGALSLISELRTFALATLCIRIGDLKTSPL